VEIVSDPVSLTVARTRVLDLLVLLLPLVMVAGAAAAAAGAVRLRAGDNCESGVLRVEMAM
jgi:hypothetical protein